METADPAGGWRVFGASVTGERHVRAGVDNQDALLWQPDAGPGRPLAVAVADGHGAAEYVRSGRGAQIAVSVATSELLRLATSRPSGEDPLTAIKREATERLPQVLVRRWEQEVREHLAARPLPPQTFDAIEEKVGAARRRRLEANPLRAYGTTLIAALVMDDCAVYVQLGDGELLVVAEDGAVTQPFPRDPRLIANETTSFVTADAWREVRVGFQALPAGAPAAMLLSTDGYANAFKDAAAFLRVGSDVVEMLRELGPDAVQASVGDWLGDATRLTGDDVTLAVLYRPEAVASARPEDADVRVPERQADDSLQDDRPAIAATGDAATAAAATEESTADAPVAGRDAPTTEVVEVLVAVELTADDDAMRAWVKPFKSALSAEARDDVTNVAPPPEDPSPAGHTAGDAGAAADESLPEPEADRPPTTAEAATDTVGPGVGGDEHDVPGEGSDTGDDALMGEPAGSPDNAASAAAGSGSDESGGEPAKEPDSSCDDLPEPNVDPRQAATPPPEPADDTW